MAEIVRKTTSMHDKDHVGFLRTYYVNGEEVYREVLNKNLDIENTAGRDRKRIF